MSDDKSKVGALDRARVGAGQDYEIDDFAQKFGLSREQVRELIHQHGNDRTKLEAAAHELKSAGPGP
ncbi:DUF3606 domain-containing protein [Chelatococcus reniformis]|uniref:DUF3606 domain-containing protein n=1 Tax=Chelatococcus reniformis TaxID=1494448 RepID=A0A916UK22_9HYPH|nr:DUF3606 domain-containing protein [Chelatococcus reniformis]GGC76007.1 hypothetical protein GCM10010994_37990 [Chelatococcus reniformis]